MSLPAALAYTGLALLFAALVVAFAAPDAYGHRKRQRLAAVGWALFAIGIANLVGAAWWEALS